MVTVEKTAIISGRSVELGGVGSVTGGQNDGGYPCYAGWPEWLPRMRVV